MLYWFSQWGETDLFNVFRYITFRTAMAAVTAFFLCLWLAPRLRRWLIRHGLCEPARRADAPDLDSFQQTKEGTPTMGGVIILASVFLSLLLWVNWLNAFVVVSLFSGLYLAVLGAWDDWVKIKSRPGQQRGLRARMKILWEVGLGCFVGSYVYFSPHTEPVLTFPFFKNLVLFLGMFYLLFVACVIIGTANAVNLTDGLDGLATGCLLTVTATLTILSYVTGHAGFSRYLFLTFIPGTGELAVVCGAMFGALLGFLWYNCHPAEIFMGDVGSLSLGGTVGVIAVLIKQELLLILLGGVFVMEAVSVIVQVFCHKLWRRRPFKMAPWHHHLQLSGWPESKIIVRLWILSTVFALLSLATLKFR